MLDLAQIRVETLEEKDEKGIFVIEPLDPGFGHTIGNSLRRTLLSSLPGVAITQVKIDGVRHQFSTLSGLREDIIEFILNLKKVRVKSDSDKPVKLTLNVTGPKEVTASDIKASTGATIINPNNTKGCFETIIILDFMASMAFNFPKTIKGTTKNVTKDSIKEIRVPIMLSPANSRRVESPILNNVITNMAIKILAK